MLLKKVGLPLILLIAFVCLLIFISTTIELTNTLAGEVRSFSIGFDTPWYQQISDPGGRSSQQLNLLAPSFLSGIAGFFIIFAYLRYNSGRE